MVYSACRAIVAPDVVYPGGPGPFYSLDQGLGKRERPCDFVAANLRQGWASDCSGKSAMPCSRRQTKTATGHTACRIVASEPGIGWERFRRSSA